MDPFERLQTDQKKDMNDVDDIDDPLNQICFMQTEDLQPNLDNLR